jgi:hypothetical protein
VRAPAFRASWTKFAIKGVNQNPQRDALRRAIGDQRLELIRRTTVVDWLPIAIHLGIADATVEVLGNDDARTFWKERLLASFHTKTMGPFVAGASIVFGVQPYALMKIAMTSYRLMAKNAGHITVTARDDGAVLMDFQEMPQQICDSPGWHALCHGQCQAVLAYLTMTGDISFRNTGPNMFRYIMLRTK